jgi:flagellar biogenesis protein FliO
LRLEFQTLLANLLFLELLALQLFLVKKLEKRRSKEFHQLQYLKLNHQFQRE